MSFCTCAHQSTLKYVIYNFLCQNKVPRRTHLTKEHPDPECYHLKTLAACAALFLEGSYESAPLFLSGTNKFIWRDKGMCFGLAGTGKTAGTFFDWCSLYQNPRTAEEKAVFDMSLKDINLWYAHQATIIWMFTAMPSNIENTYSERGWPNFEMFVSELISASHSVLNISSDIRTHLLDSSVKEYGQLVTDTMKSERRPPLSPDEFNTLIETKVFTNGADCDNIVKPKYAQTFRVVIACATQLDFSNLGWANDELEQCMVLIKSHCPQLKKLDLSSNQFSKTLEELAEFPATAQMEDISFLKCKQIRGDICGLADLPPFARIWRIDLRYTQVSGDISTPLSSLVNLTDLSLGSTQVSGQITALSGLVNLTILDLSSTQVSGEITALSGLVNLTQLNLYSTQVSGEISALSGLVNLTILDLGYTQVSGEITALSGLVNLTVLQLKPSKISGDFTKFYWVETSDLRRVGRPSRCCAIG